MMAQTRYESSSSYVQCENKVYVQTRTTVRPTNSLSRYTKRYVSVTHAPNNASSSTSAPRLDDASMTYLGRAEGIIKAEFGEPELKLRQQNQQTAFKNAASSKSSKTDGRSLLGNSRTLRDVTENGPAADKSTAADADDASKTDNGSAVVATGFAVIADYTDKVTANDFFTPGRVFAVRVKHSHFPERHEQPEVAYCTMSLKFSDHNLESPLDLVLITGRHGPYFNASTMDQFHTALKSGSEDMKRYLMSMPVCLSSVLDGLRHNPETYTDQHYYSHVIHEWAEKDGRVRLARFRAVPADGRRDTGRLTPDEHKQVWNYLCGDNRDASGRPQPYLRDEYLRRLESGKPVSFCLQAQFHDVKPAEDGDEAKLVWYNPTTPWYDSVWIDVAFLNFYSPLPPSSTEAMSFSAECVPAPAISIPGPADDTDFNSVAAVEAAMEADRLTQVATKEAAKEEKLEAVEDESVEMTDYLVFCVTGDQVNAGTTADIHVSIVGTTGRTPYMKLSKTSKTDLSRSDKKTFVLRERPIGLLRYVQLYNEGKTAENNWFVTHVVLSTPYNNKCYTLPCHRWLVNRSVLSLRDGAAVTPVEELEDMAMLRGVETSDRQQQITWCDQTQQTFFTDLSGYVSAVNDVNSLPIDLLTPAAKDLDKSWADHNNSKSSVLKSFLRLFTSRKGSLTVEFEKQLADSTEKKYQDRKQLVHVLRHWREDEEFARQLVNNTHPSQVTRLYEMPEFFSSVTHNSVREQLQPGRKLQQEIDDGKLFMISYPELTEFAKLCFVDDLDNSSENAEAKPKKTSKVPVRYISSPSVLLYLKQEEEGRSMLVPLAIRINTPSSTSQTSYHTWNVPAPQTTTPVFTRRDDVGDEYSDWLVAKMWVRVADVHYHILGSLITSRLLTETVSLAVYRCLPSVHPVFKLLMPHLSDVAAVNTVYRRHVLDATNGLAKSLALGDRDRGLCVKFISERLHGMTVQMLDQRQSFSKLGPYATAIQGYWYRDDSLELWDVIWKFVQEVLSLYYNDDLSVVSDGELTAMLSELRQHSITTLGLSEQFSSLESLTQFVTIFIFTCTVQQTALRRTMLDAFAYCPNAPPCMMTAPPSERHVVGYTEQQVRDMLPKPEVVDNFIGDVMMLAGSDKSASESLLHYKNHWFTEESAQKVMDKFRSSLRQISDNMKRRNKQLETPFDYLLPEKIYMRYDV